MPGNCGLSGMFTELNPPPLKPSGGVTVAGQSVVVWLTPATKSAVTCAPFAKLRNTLLSP